MSEFYHASAIAGRLGKLPPWRLLDCAEKTDDGHLVGFKNFTVNEAFFVGHFPNHPICPGVLQLEAIRQLCVLFLPGDPESICLKKVEKVKFRRPVLPGDRMKVTAEPLDSSDGEYRYRAACLSASGGCSEAVVTLGKVETPSQLPAIPEFNAEFDRGDANAMNIDKVMALMPHRYPFLLIDYIAKADGSKVTAVKNVTGNEAFFGAGFQTMPEVLLCEIAAQAGCASVLSRPENAGKLGFFMAIDSAVYHRRVLPGEQLLVEADLPAGKSRFGRGPCRILVGAEVVFEITLMFAIVDA